MIVSMLIKSLHKTKKLISKIEKEIAKTTLIHAWLEVDKEIKKSVSEHTRGNLSD